MKKRKAYNSHYIARGFINLMKEKELDWDLLNEYMDRMTEDDMWLTLRLILVACHDVKAKKK